MVHQVRNSEKEQIFGESEEAHTKRTRGQINIMGEGIAQW